MENLFVKKKIYPLSILKDYMLHNNRNKAVNMNVNSVYKMRPRRTSTSML